MNGRTVQSGRLFKAGGGAAIVVGAISVSGMGVPSQARADYVPVETPFTQGAPLKSLLQASTAGGSSLNTTQVVWGTSLTVNQLSLPSAGVLSIKLSDIGWTESLSSLSFLVTDLDSVWQRIDGTGSLLVNVSGPTQLFAAVFASSVTEGVGLYNLQASFAPVPLPAAGWLLLSALGGLGILCRKSPPQRGS